MQQIDFETLLSQVKTKQLKYYNLYNADISAKQYFAVQYFKNNKHDVIDIKQPISISFCDIECFTNHGPFGDIKNGKHPINAITECNTVSNIISVFFLLSENNYKILGLDDDFSNVQDVISSLENYYTQILKENNYFTDDSNINENIKVKVYLFNNDLDLIKSYFNLVHQLDPLSLGGFNSDSFDYPYIYFRLLRLLNGNHQEVANIMSKLGHIERNGNYINIAEYSLYDVRYFYVPRDEGGMNYGKRQPMYSLDWIAQKVLKLGKLEYKDDNMSLDQFYEQDPKHFLLYNIIDCCITKRLSDKLSHINTHNNIRRLAKVPFSYSIRGTSAIYDTLVLYEQTERNKFIRFGISSEKGKNISKEELEHFPKPVIKKKRLVPGKIDVKTFRTITSKYSGAYVKNPKPAIINTGLTIDLDASLPPWEKILVRRNGIVKWIEIGDYEHNTGDETLSWDDTNNTCWAPINAKLKHNWSGNLVTLVTENNYITVTANHSVFTDKGIADANQLQVGDKLVIHNSPKIVFEKITDIEYEFYEGEVYDISVEKYERFFGGTGIGAHNSSLYPSMMVQSNISFDTFAGYVLNPCTYITLQGLEKMCGSTTKIPLQLPQKLSEMIQKHVYSNDYSNKTDAFKAYYYTSLYLYSKILESNMPIQRIFDPQDDIGSFLLRFYLIPLLDIINTVHLQSSPEFNQFAYDYLFLNEDDLKKKYKVVYIVNNIFETNSTIKKLDLQKAIEYIQQFIITIAGTLFFKHNVKKGLFFKIITELWDLRKAAKKKRDEFKVGSPEYKMYDALQLTYKIANNSIYGVHGLTTFRYSSHLIAQSITAQGRLVNKLAQWVSEKSLEAKFGEYPR